MKKKKGDETTKRLSEFSHHREFGKAMPHEGHGLFDVENLCPGDFGLSFLRFIAALNEQ